MTELGPPGFGSDSFPYHLQVGAEVVNQLAAAYEQDLLPRGYPAHCGGLRQAAAQES